MRRYFVMANLEDLQVYCSELEAQKEELENELSNLTDKYTELLDFVSNFRLLSHSLSDGLSNDIDAAEDELVAQHSEPEDFIDGNNFKKD